MFGFKKLNTLKFRKKIFKKTIKPKEYVHIDKPVTNQDYRQVHFNNWCKAKNVFCGSYLPKNPFVLLIPKKGWKKRAEYKDCKVLQFERKSTGQIVQYHFEDESRNDRINHYHWEVEDKKLRKEKQYSREKKECKKHSEECHILPYDYKYEKKNIPMLKIKLKHRE